MSKSDPFSASADLPELELEADAAAEKAERAAEAVERARLRLERVQEVSAVGMALLRDLGERVAAAKVAPNTKVGEDEDEDEGEGEDEPASPADAAGDFAKISRALRFTLELEARFDEALRDLQSGKAATLNKRCEARAQRDAKVEEDRRRTRLVEVETQVAIAIERESESEEAETERFAALEERLEYDNAYTDLTERPLREVVGQLCADIGLTVDWTGWHENGWPGPPTSGPGARSRWSPYRTASPRPIESDDPAPAGSGLARPPP